MRILLLAPHPYYIDRGTPIALDTLLRALSHRGDTVDAVIYADGEDRTYPGITLHRIHPPRFLRKTGPGFSLRKLLCDIWLFMRAWSLLRQHRYEVIHAGEESVYLAMFFRLIYRVPYVYDMDSSMAQQLIEKMRWLRPIASLLNWGEGLAIRHALAVAPVCEALAEIARHHKARHVTLLHDISQLPSMPPPSGALRQELRIDGPIVMYVGNFEAYQGLDLLLHAFAVARQRGSEASLVLAGGSEAHIAQYKALSQTLNIHERTHFIGPWPANRLEQLLAEADILTSPRTQGINTPMKVFPYLHSGKPLLATDLRTHNQILTPQISRLAPADPEEFGQAMLELAQDEALRRKLGTAARDFVECNHVFASHQTRVDQLYQYVASAISASNATRKLVHESK